MELVLNLERKSNEAMYKVLAEAIKQAIGDGRLKPGARMPSTREFAESLQISRQTVLRAFEELVSQGYLDSEVGSGTYVSERLPIAQAVSTHASSEKTSAPVKLSNYAKRLLESYSTQAAAEDEAEEMSFGISNPEELPLTVLERMLLRHCHLSDPSVYSQIGDPLGHYPLRQAIASYLGRARAVRTTGHQVAIFAGLQPAMDLLCRLLLNEGDTVIVENPCYAGVRRTFTSHGARVISVDTDADGIRTDRLSEISDCKLLYITPSHQDPTGVVLSSSRRHELLRYAQQTGALIWEDDYDSEYRYGNTPAPALQGLDTNENVIYFSSLWKTLGPVVRLGFLVLPPRLVHVVSTARSVLEPAPPMLEQYALTDFIGEGHLEKHIHRTRVAAAKRRSALVQAMIVELGNLVKIARESSGMHLLARFDTSLSEFSILSAAKKAGLSVLSTRSYYLDRNGRGEFLIAFANGDEKDIHPTVKTFAKALKA